MFNFVNLEKAKGWYLENLGKLLLFFIIVVIVSLTVVYTPYLSFIFSPGLRVFIISLSLYLLFPFSTNRLVIIGFTTIIFAFIFTVLEMNFIAEPLGELLYLILIFIFVNYVRLMIKEIKSF